MKKLKQIIQQLNEMPSLVPPLDFALSDDSGNAWRLRELVSNAKLIEVKSFYIGSEDKNVDISIFKSDDSIYAVKDNKIIFLVTLEENELKDYGLKYVTQIEIWRSRRGAIGISDYIFWKYVFSKYDTVVSDESQTENGKTFWEGITEIGKDKGLFVYRIDTWNKQIIKSKSRDDMFGKDTYGVGDFFKRFRLILTKKEI